MADRKAVPLLEKLKANPTDAAALSQLGAVYSSAHQFPQSTEYYLARFNLGMMKWKGKDDAAGAIATWQELLRSNPNLDRTCSSGAD